MTTRREILRLIPVLSCFAAQPASMHGLVDRRQPVQSSAHSLALVPLPQGSLTPLDTLAVETSVPGRLLVRDGDGSVYVDTSIDARAEITIGGALGSHTVALLNGDGQLVDLRTFVVDCHTQVEDAGGLYGALLNDLYWTMATDGPVGAMRYKGKVFTYWASWLLDNTSTLKGMRYFWPEVTSNVDFYASSQREDGMIWENFEARTPPETGWDQRFGYGDFARSAENGYLQLRRAPVENHVEHLFLEAIYLAWQTTGDTAWMAAKLDAARRAVHYATHDPYRWSTQYQLLKRGFTIDTWDFLCDSEAALVDGDIMKIDLGSTHFGIFFGDNTNMIAGLRRLAVMLEAAGRGDQAPEYRALADDLEKRLNALSWNGEFFTHWIPEDRRLTLDMGGTDIYRQVALSNAYSLNRGIAQAKSVAILKTYQRIRREMPSTSPGEFYAIYPPFESGFNIESVKWEYMNGGVMSCTAGELARGAFQHGYERYGADILRRQKSIADRHLGFLPGILRGKQPEAPARTMTPVDLRSVVNADFWAGVSGGVTTGVPGWTNEPGNDLASMPTGLQTFRGVPFDVIDPRSNARRACLGISTAPGYRQTARLSINAKAATFYLLHTLGGDDLAGKLTVRYEDGSSHFEYIRAGVNVNHWWSPVGSQFDNRYGPGRPERMQVAWRGGNQKFGNVGVYVTGFEHPHPQKTIVAVEFASAETSAKWMILGVTLSDAPVFLPPWNDVSTGMPNNWGAAAVISALLEGLAGAEDTGIAFKRVRLAPRWAAADVLSAKVAVRYPASRGYVRYDYAYHPDTQEAFLRFSSSAEEVEVAILLPEDAKVHNAVLDGKAVTSRIETVEDSRYICVSSFGPGAHTFVVRLA